MFIPFQGKTQCEPFAKVASVAIAVGDVLVFTVAGYVTPAGTTSASTAGIALRAITSSSDDYADNTLVPVVMLTDDLVFLADVGTGTASQANVGKRYDLAAAGTVDLSASARDVVTVVGVISTTKVLVKFNSAYAFINSHLA